MRLARVLCVLLPVGLVGCLHNDDRPHWTNRISLLHLPTAEDAASIEYVLIERTAGGEEINRRVWDRIDEQILPFETRTMLEEAGLRVGIASESAPGPLRKLIEDPRTDRGHRHRTFPLDKPAPLMLSDPLARAEFSIPTSDGHSTRFARDLVALGFDITIRDAADGKVQVRFVPRARYRDRARLLPTDPADREQATETFPSAAFEITFSPAEYLVIGTDSYWEGTFGHMALTAEHDERPVQRLLVLRAGRSKSQHDAATLLTSSDKPSAPPLASQASLARGSQP
ncbi:MAG TPA: hypothetical protein VKD71_07540 [Gemmataceae bacterium]|nr:hypothetical protein [Gemmataceae bacterium]